MYEVVKKVERANNEVKCVKPIDGTIIIHLLRFDRFVSKIYEQAVNKLTN